MTPDGKALYFAREKKGHEGVKGCLLYTSFVRTSGISENASESEKRTYGRLYPVIVLMNLFLMLMFAYMAVSYTHLDVYKRQTLFCPGSIKTD